MKFIIITFLTLPLLFLNSVLLSQTPKEFKQLVDHDRKSAQTWWYAWIGGYTAATIGQGAVNLTSDEKSLRQDMALGAGTTLLGVVGTIFTPIVPNKAVMKKYGFNPGDTARSQAYYESMLKEIAEREKAGRSWKVHAVAGVVDLGSGMITWLGFKRTFLDGVINFALNTVIAEAQIWSQPTRAVRDYKRYCIEKKGETGQPINKPSVKIYIGSYPGGINMRLVF